MIERKSYFISVLVVHEESIQIGGVNAYDGIPLWLAKKFPPPSKPFPFPFKTPPSNWFDNYLTVAISEAFQNFYKNSSGSLFYWSRFWAKVAYEFRGFPNLFGYEFINEPWAGDIYAKPDLFIPGLKYLTIAHIDFNLLRYCKEGNMFTGLV